MVLVLKKCQVFGNFLTVKWQLSGGTDHNKPGSKDGVKLEQKDIYVNVIKLLLAQGGP